MLHATGVVNTTARTGENVLSLERGSTDLATGVWLTCRPGARTLYKIFRSVRAWVGHEFEESAWVSAPPPASGLRAGRARVLVLRLAELVCLARFWFVVVSVVLVMAGIRGVCVFVFGLRPWSDFVGLSICLVSYIVGEYLTGRHSRVLARSTGSASRPLP